LKGLGRAGQLGIGKFKIIKKYMTKEIILASKSKNIIPLKVQKEYVQYHKMVDNHELSETILLNESRKLFLKKDGLEKNKKLLYLLAHNGSLKTYRILQRYRKKTDKPLKAWVEMCLQECAGNLKAELLDQKEIFMIINGAGGDGQRLRYYFIFSSIKFKLFTVAQKAVIKKLTKAVDKKLKGKTEHLDFGKNYILLSVLLPMDIAAEEYFQEIYKAVNSKKKILRNHYYSNNVQRPTLKDLEEYLANLR
jgi:hypothetical protein